MGNTRHFWLDVAWCALLAILFWAACAGIGNRILPRPGVPTPDPDDDQVEGDGPIGPATWHQPGIAACVGLGALLLLGGFGVLFRIPWWLFVVPFVGAGLVFAAIDLSRAGIARMRTSALVIGGVAVIAVGLVALVEAPVGLRLPLNVCDDWRAYMPYAHRLIDTYGLDEAWSVRRVQSLGGFDLMRALPVWVFGDAGIGVAETVVASVFLAGLFVANGMRSAWARLVSLGLILAVPLLWVPRTNSTGVLIGTPLLVAVFAATVELRKALRAGDLRAAVRWAVGAGLVIAALMSVRPNLGLLGAIVVTLGALLATGTKVLRRVQALLAAGGAALVAFAPWSIAMWRTAGTPLYPLFPGNLNNDPVNKPVIDGFGDLVSRAWDLMVAGPYLWATLAVLVVALVARKLLPDATLVAIAALGTVGVTAVFALNTPFAPWPTVIRYFAPMSQGLAVFALCEMLRGADARPWRAPSSSWRRVAMALGVGATLAIFAFAFSTIGFATTPFIGGYRLVDNAVRNRLQPPPGSETTTQALRDSYRDAFAGVDPDRTIVAVDRPYLIDYSRYDVQNLDAPGYMTADGKGFPFFSGPVPKIERLRGAGFDTLVATDPVADICLTPVRINAALETRPDDRDAYSHFLDWDGDIQAIARDAPDAVQRHGNLLVIDLARAQRALRTNAG